MVSAKVGAAQNYWIETAAASAVLATLSVWQRAVEPAEGSVRRWTIIPMLLLTASVAAYPPLVGLASVDRFQELWPQPDRLAALDQAVELVRSEPGEVLAHPLDVVVLAGRPVLFEPGIFSILHRAGRWDAGPLVCRIRRGEIRLLVLGEPLDHDSAGLHGFPTWPAPILAALRETMVLETRMPGRLIYVPRTDASTAGC